MSIRCFCTFEGGGAKGIAHVGALAALEEAGLDLRGFAGTSAGAVIAALAAAGYSAADMVHADGTILDLVDLDPTNIWGGKAFKPASRASGLFGWRGWLGIRFLRSVMLVPVPLIVGLACLVVLAPPLFGTFGGLSAPDVLIAEIAVLANTAFFSWLASNGFAALDTFETGLNQLMRLKLTRLLDPPPGHRSREPKVITFADLQRIGCPPLKIVAANISCRRLELFSSATTPDVSVAAAVAASVCLPVVFKPRTINGHLHLDGGLVSNLPAWTFDSERAMDRDAWTAVVAVGKQIEPKKPAGFQILTAGMQTGLFGTSVLNIRNVERLRAVRLKVDLNLLQFDPGHGRAREVVEEAKVTCQQRLVHEIVELPKQMSDICARIAVRAERRITQAQRALKKPVDFGSLRTSILVQHPEDARTLVAEYQVGFEDFPDERIRLPVDGSFAGRALRDAAPVYLDDRDPEWGTFLQRPEDRWLRKVVWPAMRWVLCIPHVHPDGGNMLVVSIDSDAYIDLAANLRDIVMSAIADDVSKILDQLLPFEDFSNGRAQGEFAGR